MCIILKDVLSTKLTSIFKTKMESGILCCLIFILVLFPIHSFSLKCYHCEGNFTTPDYEEECGISPNLTTVIDCMENENACYIETRVNETEIEFRGCTQISEHDKKYDCNNEANMDTGNGIRICYCFSDDCNKKHHKSSSDTIKSWVHFESSIIFIALIFVGVSLGVIILLCIFCAICYCIKNKNRQESNSNNGGYYLENGKYNNKNRLSKPKHTSTPVHKSKASILDGNDDDEKLIPNENGLVSDPLLLANQEQTQQNIDALEMAVRYGNFVTVDFLLNSGLKFDSNKTWLHFAAKNSSDINVLKNIFDMVPPKNRHNQKDALKRTPVHAAAENGHLEHLKFLVEEKNLEVEPVDVNGDTPLHLAVESSDYIGTSNGNYQAILKYLIGLGLDKARKNKAGHTPYNIAIMQEHRKDILDILDDPRIPKIPAESDDTEITLLEDSKLVTSSPFRK